MPEETRYEVNKPDVVDESVDGEVLIVNLGTGAYYSSRGIGDLAWQALASGATALETAVMLADGASAAALPGIERYLAELLAEGLVRPRSGPAVQASFARPEQFVEPVLEKFTDMQELLLLDPIHDVEEAGWPRARPETRQD